jgi:hypothetical protein
MLAGAGTYAVAFDSADKNGRVENRLRNDRRY